MKRETLTIISNRQVNGSVWEMKLSGCSAQRPGQFVNIALDGLFLRRPISVCDWNDGVLTLLYKVVGKGTKQMTGLPEGMSLDVLTTLGNGFNTSASCEKPLLVGGGIGTAPMYYLAKTLIAAGKKVSVVLGFNKADEIICKDEFEKLGAKVIIATADGSVGVKGFVTDALPMVDYDFFYSCGPMPMFRALEGKIEGEGQYSFEERMGCGTGICMGCSCKTMFGNKRICKDGPVFDRKEVIW